jgi:hypothetical protein
LLDVLGEAALDVVAAAAARAHRAQGETTRVTHIDEFLRHRRRVGQQAEPAERVDPLEGLDDLGDGVPAGAVKTVAPRDEVARNLVFLAVLAKAHPRLGIPEIVEAHVLDLVDRRGSRRGPRLHEVAGDLGLAVHHHGLAGEGAKVDAMAHAAVADLRAVVDEPLAVHAGPDPGLIEQGDRTLLDDAGADAAEHVIGALRLEDDVVDARLEQKLAEQEAGRPGTDDGNLGPHGCSV